MTHPEPPGPSRDEGDHRTETLLPLVRDLITAVHAFNRQVVADIFEHATALTGDPLAAARHLAVIAAGMCSEDHAPTAALGWTLNPAGYRRYRSSRDALSASLQAGRDAAGRQEGNAA